MLKPWEDPGIAEACLRAWDLGRERPDGPDPEEVIRELSSFDGADAEKLRWFAVWLEKNVIPDWNLVRRLYVEAVRRDPSDARLFCSWAVAATSYADFVPEKDRAPLLLEAIQSAENAMRFAPDDADVHYTLGLALYGDESRSIAEAEAEFRAAVTLRPDYVAARLYLAHTLQDLERWEEALHELRCIDESRLLIEFGSIQQWRIVKLREQIAVCLLRLGRIGDAEPAVRKFLEVAELADSGDFEAPEQLARLGNMLPESLAERINAISAAKIRSDRLGGL